MVRYPKAASGEPGTLPTREPEQNVTTSPGLGPEHSPRSPLSIHDLTVAYDRKPVLWDVDLDVPAGELVTIVGPNGAGKSTLLKAALGLIPVASGTVRVFGKPMKSQRSLVAYVPQRESVDWDFPVTALDVVTMGRYGALGWCRPVRRRQKNEAMQALERVGLADMASRQISQLSGGQQQRVFLARALAQDAQLFLMDEPLASVDAATEQAIVDVLRSLRSEGRTVVVVHHDLQTVNDYFDSVILLNMRVVAHGPVETAFTPEALRQTYGGQLTILSEASERLARSSGVDHP